MINLIEKYTTEYNKYDQPKKVQQACDFHDNFIAETLGNRICYVECLANSDITISQYKNDNRHYTVSQKRLYNFLNPQNMQKYFNLDQLLIPPSVLRHPNHIIDPNINYMFVETEQILIKKGYQLYTIPDAYALIDQYVKRKEDIPTFEDHFQIIMCVYGASGPYSHWTFGYLYFECYRPVLNIGSERIAVPKIYIKKIK